MKSTNYKNHIITRSATTTSVTKTVFGKQTDAIGYLYSIEGVHGKTAGMRPLLTSVSACREYINEKIDAAE